MAELVFDQKHGEQAAEMVSAVLNGELQQSIVDAFNCVKQIGEDNPIVDGLQALCRQYESVFNESAVPLANKMRENMLAHSELAKIFNSVSVAKVADAADMGTVSDNNYDAAKIL